MSNEPPSADQAATLPQTSAESLGEELQHCRRALRDLIEIGSELAAMIARQALAQEDNPAQVQKSAAAYNAVAQSVRRSVMLQEKLGKPRKAATNRTAARKKIIRDVEDAIDSNADGDQAEKLHAELLERLDSPDLEEEIGDRPIAEIITDICRDLGIGIAALPDTHPWKRRNPHDIAILNARAAQPANAAPSAELTALLATAPPPPPRPPRPRAPLPDVKKMTTAEIEARLKILRRRPDT